jgi:subtilisin family serine protease
MYETPRPGWLLREFGNQRGEGVSVGVVDSGWDYSNQSARVCSGINFVSEGKEPRIPNADECQDRIGHGTICTDLILRVVPAATVIPLRIFGTRYRANLETVIRAIEYASDSRISILSLSLSTLQADCVHRLYRACARATSNGVVIVASAFGSQNLPGGPAAFEPVIGVGVFPFNGVLQFDYRRGEAIEFVASAPSHAARGLGGHLLRVWPQASYSTATITGLAALLRARFPSASYLEIRRNLANLAHLTNPWASSLTSLDRECRS